VSNTRYADLVQLNTRYVSLVGEKALYGQRLADADAVLAQAGPLDAVTVKQQTVDQLIYLLGLHSTAANAKSQLEGKLSTLQGTQAVQLKIDAFTGMLARLDALQDILQQHSKAKAAVVAATQGVEAAARQYADAETDLKAAWDTAGGICPLCEQPIGKEVLSCEPCSH